MSEAVSACLIFLSTSSRSGPSGMSAASWRRPAMNSGKSPRRFQKRFRLFESSPRFHGTLPSAKGRRARTPAFVIADGRRRPSDDFHLPRMKPVSRKRRQDARSPDAPLDGSPDGLVGAGILERLLPALGGRARRTCRPPSPSMRSSSSSAALVDMPARWSALISLRWRWSWQRMRSISARRYGRSGMGALVGRWQGE